MTRVIKGKEKQEVDLSPYVNKDTGELLVDEILDKDTVLTVNKQTNMITLHSDDYAVIETEALLILSQILNNSDLANVIKMSVTLKTPLNIVYNGAFPHTNESLQKYLEVGSESMFMKLVRRLMKAGVLYQIKGRIYGEVRVCYMLNPFLSRKRKQFESKVFEAFEKFDKTDNKVVD